MTNLLNSIKYMYIMLCFNFIIGLNFVSLSFVFGYGHVL